MILDWHIVATMLKLIIPAGVGAAIDRLLQKRPKLVCFYSSVATHTVNVNPPLQVHTCSIVVRNVGRASAHNLVIPHLLQMENVHVYPALPYLVRPLPGNAEELVFPIVVPKQEITISYLYYPPLVFNQIHTRPRSDEGFAKFVPMNLTRYLSRLQRIGVLVVFGIGLLTILYFLIAGGTWLYERLPTYSPAAAHAPTASKPLPASKNSP